MLKAAYSGGVGAVPCFSEWWENLTGDEEYEQELCVLAVDRDGVPAGLAQCWSSGFVKDLAVAEIWRRRTLGRSLLYEVFHRFTQRGLPHVDLKVHGDNLAALGLYRSLGMTVV
ncbi:MAG: GNAT family N-acetyltransferase [Devosia marina]|uniref:GNAT family N-acetyltransferase n=1 Tax=Devosia marina TaxID=2683198 RepID=UPI0032EE57F1